MIVTSGWLLRHGWPRLDSWWGISRRVTLALMQNRPVAYVEGVHDAKTGENYGVSIIHAGKPFLQPLVDQLQGHIDELIASSDTKAKPRLRLVHRDDTK